MPLSPGRYLRKGLPRRITLKTILWIEGQHLISSGTGSQKLIDTVYYKRKEDTCELATGILFMRATALKESIMEVF
jgi:hypothetical protein